MFTITGSQKRWDEGAPHLTIRVDGVVIRIAHRGGYGSTCNTLGSRDSTRFLSV